MSANVNVILLICLLLAPEHTLAHIDSRIVKRAIIDQSYVNHAIQHSTYLLQDAITTVVQQFIIAVLSPRHRKNSQRL